MDSLSWPMYVNQLTMHIKLVMSLRLFEVRNLRKPVIGKSRLCPIKKILKQMIRILSKVRQIKMRGIIKVTAPG